MIGSVTVGSRGMKEHVSRRSLSVLPTMTFTNAQIVTIQASWLVSSEMKLLKFAQLHLLVVLTVVQQKNQIWTRIDAANVAVVIS